MATNQGSSQLENILRRARRDLGSLGASGALVGGLAVSSRTEPRFTRDVDLAISVSTDAEAESLVLRLQQRGYRTHALVEQKARERLATIRLVPPDGRDPETILDLLFSSSGIEPEIVSQAESLEVFPGLWIPVARIGHLVVLKLLARDDARRPQDSLDLRSLSSVVTDSEAQVAREAAHLIQERGYGRGRDLLQALEDFLATEP